MKSIRNAAHLTTLFVVPLFIFILVVVSPSSASAESVELSFGELQVDGAGRGTLELEIRNWVAISGFQFELTGFEITGSSGGETDQWDFDVSGDGLVAVEPNGGYIIPGTHTLAVLDVESAGSNIQEGCLTSVVFSDPAGTGLSVRTAPCLNLGATLSFGTVTQTSETTGTIDVLVRSLAYPVSGFQFGFDGVEINSVGGGDTVGGGWSVSNNQRGIVGTNLSGGSLPAGDSVLTVIAFTVDQLTGTACLTEPRVADYTGYLLNIVNDACINLGVTVEIGAVNLLNNTFEIDVESPFFPISGFQLGLDGITLDSVYGGETTAWSVSANNDIVVGLDLMGDPIPSGEFTLTTVAYGVGATEVCLDSGRFANPHGNGIFTVLGECKSLVTGQLPPAAFSCSSDPPYTQPTVNSFLPGLFPGERIQLCPVEADEGTMISGVTVTLVSPELPGGQLEVVNSVYDPPRIVVLPRCGDGVPRQRWENGEDVCHGISGDIQVEKGTPSGNYVLHYGVSIVHEDQTELTDFDVPWVRIDLPISVNRILSAISAYISPGVGVIPADPAGNADAELARHNAEDSLIVYDHATAAYEQGAMSTVYAAVSDVHEMAVTVRNCFNDSRGDLHFPAHGEEIGKLLHELYRASSLESRYYLEDDLHVSLDPNVEMRFTRAGAMMDLVLTETSANPVIDVSWGLSRQLAVQEGITGQLETQIGERLTPSPWEAEHLNDLIRSRASALDTAIQRSGGRMLGQAENAVVLQLANELDPLLGKLSGFGASNYERGQIVYKLFELMMALQDARQDAHLGNGPELHWDLLAIYTVVKNLLPNAQANVCGLGSNPWYEENAFRWGYLEDALVDYGTTLAEADLRKFTRAALSVGGDWKQLRDPVPAPRDPFDDPGLADTFCGILYLYMAAYSSDEPPWDYQEDGNDNCYYQSESLPMVGCPEIRVDWYPACGASSSSIEACEP